MIQLIGVLTFGHWLKEDNNATRSTLFHVQVYYSLMSLIFLDPISFVINVFLAVKCHKFAQHLDPEFKKNKKFMLIYGQDANEMKTRPSSYAKQNMYGKYKQRPG